MSLMMDHPDSHAAKASIREVYAIVSQLETKLVEELHRVEGRLTEEIRDRDEKHAEEIVSIRRDVDDLKVWRDEVEHGAAIKEARTEARTAPIKMGLYWLEEHWRLVTALMAIIFTILLVLLDIRVDVGHIGNVLP